MGKAREFYIEQTKISYMVGEPVYRVIDRPQSLLEERTSVCCFHTIEKSAYNKAVEALKEIKDNRNPCDFYEFIYPLVCKTLRELGELNVQE